MKKYCLKPEAKTSLLEGIQIIGIVMGVVFAAIVIIGMLTMGMENHTDGDYFLYYVGWFGWIILIPFSLVYAKRWLLNNIEECK